MARWYGRSMSPRLLRRTTSTSKSLTVVSVAVISTHYDPDGVQQNTLFVSKSYPVSEEQKLKRCPGVGHEIVGHATRVGSKVKGIKVGDRVGVGAQSGACINQKGDCDACADGLEQHCPRGVNTYNSKWPNGSNSYGGYADYWRGQSDLVIPIPDSIPSDVAAPMLCGGITAFSPLMQHGAGPGE
jgi:D-arabinose 1-dehydrogenase-like Zn-dependent alcohol dehydrogenase